ncbi:glycosyltransferase family 4 protein [Nitratiruptor sp. SB155-2]|uniref:glycosyltransferase family 4 protein n=1 Tax=Nitratiruptor sp. (strain SB155-2) TaxID=387092 RepID=UPI00015873F5|nr:glycosyltransferase family 1 protein [Nitratiruptor sp. SB155-2]BAF70492.1 glycosyl transferase [Nitratiruptor sp. SB155-2]
MKIVVDALPLTKSLTGVGKYIYEISKRVDQDLLFWYGGFVSQRMFEPKEGGVFTHVIESAIAVRAVKKTLRIMVGLLKNKDVYDLYWEPNYIFQKGIRSKKKVVTIHDMSIIRYPQWHPKERVKYFSKHLFSSIDEADMIITDSCFSKQEIVELSGCEESKIEVIHLGADHNLYKPLAKEKLKHLTDRFALEDDFVLFVGSIEPRKNLLNLLKAYMKLPEPLKKRYPLVLAGFKGWENKEIMQIIEQENIRYLGYVSENDLVGLYNLASVFVYPSFYEGFGLPPLEAMSCQTATIVSDVASLPEVCGDAALYIDPYDVDDIALKLQFLLEDRKKSESLAEAGRKRALQFDWEKTADKHMELFERVVRC